MGEAVRNINRRDLQVNGASRVDVGPIKKYELKNRGPKAGETVQSSETVLAAFTVKSFPKISEGNSRTGSKANSRCTGGGLGCC